MRRAGLAAAAGKPVRVNGVALGPDSPLRKGTKAKGSPTTEPVALTRLRSDDPIDPLGRMNKLERRRAGELEAMRLAGVIRAWYFEAIALILADRTRYHPDFVIIGKLGMIEIEEVKGFWRDDARAKTKIASRHFPFFVFRALSPNRRKKASGWHIEEIAA